MTTRLAFSHGQHSLGGNAAFGLFVPICDVGSSRRKYRDGSARSTVFESAVLDEQDSAIGRVFRRGLLGITYPDDTPATAELVACTQSDIAAGSYSPKHRNRLEPGIPGIATIDLQDVRLNGDLIFSRRSHLLALNEFDVGIRVVDSDRRSTAM